VSTAQNGGVCLAPLSAVPLRDAAGRPVLCFDMHKNGHPIAFLVQHTSYGWSVMADAEQVGLFTTQRQALGEVQRRRSQLKAAGRASTVTSYGADPEPSTRSGSPSRYFGR